MSMDLDMMEVEQVVIGEEIDAPVDLAYDNSGDSYKVIIQEPTGTMLSQHYQHENLQCFQCFITFCSTKAKERHMKKSHRDEYKQQLQQSDTLFSCYVCNRTFPSSEELTEHHAVHNKEDKPFKCHHCQDSFRTFSEVMSHRRMLRKTGEGGQTEEERGKTKGRRGRPPKSAQKGNLFLGEAEAEEQQEVGVRLQLPQHPCPECEAASSAESHLGAHNKEKHGQPPPPRKAHACKDCEESFSRPEQLEAHTSRVHSSGRHTCPTCGKSFGRENSLKAHQQTHTNTGGTADGGRR